VLAENYLQHAEHYTAYHAYREQLQQRRRRQRQWQAWADGDSAMSSVTTAGRRARRRVPAAATGATRTPPRQHGGYNATATKAIGRTPIAGTRSRASVGTDRDRDATRGRPQARARAPQGQERPAAANARRACGSRREQRRRDKFQDRRSTSNRNSCVVRASRRSDNGEQTHPCQGRTLARLTRGACLFVIPASAKRAGRNLFAQADIALRKAEVAERAVV